MTTAPGVGWNENPSDVRPGRQRQRRARATGLFVEHYQKDNTLWNGDRGRTIFYQNELPYDVPNQAAWQNGIPPRLRGLPGGRRRDHPRGLWGGGVYCFFNVDPSIVVDSGFQVAGQAGGAVPQHPHRVARRQRHVIAHVINDTGGVAQGTATIPSYLASYGG